MVAVASDPDIWAGHVRQDRHKPEEFRKYFDGAISAGSALSFIDNDSSKIIGSSRFGNHDPVNRQIEIGWTFLARNYWGGQYNAEIKHLMLGHAFKFVDTVVFWVTKDNLRSRRAMEKIGGVLREGYYSRTDGNRTDAYVVFEIRKADFHTDLIGKQVSNPSRS